VAGGIQAPLTLGSASSDLLTGLGPPPLGKGDRLGFANLPTG
jgi:allophanate hydrolase subunit 2